MTTSTFKSPTTLAVGTGATTVYTVPAVTTAIVIGLIICNLTSSTVNVIVTLTKAVGGNVTNIMKNLPIATGGSFVSGGDFKLIGEASDILKVTSDTASSVDVTVGVLELS